ncbi:MAG TPA: hypothetical protein VN655_14515 [Pseudolabrys sp.]|nr:hypothetical protein [Pseudolabrys sp.]
MSQLALPAARRLALPRWLPLVAVFVLALALRQFTIANTDVSWGLTMAEKWLDGARLYIDLIEVNPPATVYLYVAPVALGRVLGIAPELVVTALVFFAIALSLWLSLRIMRTYGIVRVGEQWPLLTIVATALAILPGQNLGEREHVALILFLPWLSVAAVRAKGAVPDVATMLIAGAAAGLVAIIKPHFAAAIVVTAAMAAWSARSWRPLLAAENWIAAAMLAAYAAFVALVYPQFYTGMMPLLADVYIPVHASFTRLVLFFATPLWIASLVLIAILKGRAALRAPFSLLVAASAGFSVSYYVQLKGWSYHSYPMLALALIAVALAFIDRWHRSADDGARAARLVTAIVGALIAGTAYLWMNFAVDCSALAAPIRALKAHPKMLALTADLAYGHPLVRQAGGTWVSRVSAEWITAGVQARRFKGGLDATTDARLEADARRDRVMLTEDIARNRPDVIVVQPLPDFDWLAWARSDPALAAEMAAYRPYATVDGVLILARAGAEN